ncbi:MAG TPA: hypothetical protein ENJ09_04265 [Planctomycetes bacterium]|nr:hypothetical protein [Planctomycetota bacterium]
MTGEDKHFDANRIFLGLLVLTALEVGWGVIGGAEHLGWGKPLLWGGLLVFALLKGWLIASYFMHLRFEGWIVKGLLIPTPVLVLVIMGYVANDIADEDAPFTHPIGSMLDPATGKVVENMHEVWEPHEDHPGEATEEVEAEGGEGH